MIRTYTDCVTIRSHDVYTDQRLPRCRCHTIDLPGYGKLGRDEYLGVYLKLDVTEAPFNTFLKLFKQKIADQHNKRTDKRGLIDGIRFGTGAQAGGPQQRYGSHTIGLKLNEFATSKTAST